MPGFSLACSVFVFAFGTYAAPEARAEDPPDNPPQMVHDDGYDVTTEPPPGLLPKERGPAQSTYLDPTNIGLAVPTNALGALAIPSVLPPLGFESPLDLDELLGDIGAQLPDIDLQRLQEPVTTVLGTVSEAVGQVQATATAIAAGIHAGASSQSQQSSSPATTDEGAPGEFRLTTTASGITQTFVLTLCVPTPVNITSTNQLTPTTLVSLCPVPLALTTAVLVPPPGQPFQLYLSLQRIVGSPAVGARFSAEYDVPSASGPPLTVRFGLDSGGNAYPANGIVGAATDYNPLTNSAVEHLTMGWATDGPVGALTMEAVGLGQVRVAADSIPAESGSFALSYVNGTFGSQMTRTAAPTPGSVPTVSISAPVPRALDNTTANLVWSQVPQDYSFSLRPLLVDGRPTGVAFDGSQTRSPNSQFGLQIDYLTNGVLTARLQQQRFGSQFTESVDTTQDQNGNPMGLKVHASPGALSTLVLSSYTGGALGAVVELVDIPATASEFSFELEGTPGTASGGATVRGTAAPAFIGAMSYFTSLLGGTVSSTPQVSMTLATGATLTASPPVAIGPGAQLSLSVAGVHPSFEIVMKSSTATTGNATGVTGFTVSGTSAGAKTADQLLIEAQADPWTRARVLMNSLGQDWKFEVNLHGTIADPRGLDVTDTNAFATPTEFKQIHVTQLVSGSYQPLYTFNLRRPSSNTSGAAATAPTSVTVSNPPSSFRVGVDYVVTTDAGVCEQVADISGENVEETTGDITLVGGHQTLTASRVFVPGKWSIKATATSSTTWCAPDTFLFTMHQDVGGNPDGAITAIQAGRGRLTLRSFATDTSLDVNVVRNSSWAAIGFDVRGTNSEANPGQQIQLEQLNGATTTLALNMWSGAAGPVVTGTEGTVVVNNVPQVFGIHAERDVSGVRHTLQVRSANAAPAPAETMVITAPARDLWPGGTVRFTMRSFDITTKLDLDAASGLNLGQFDLQVHNSNVNANATEVIAVDIRDASGNAELAALLSRPAGNTSGLLTSATSGSLVWSNMPQVFDLRVQAIVPAVQELAYGGKLELKVSHASATPESTMLFTQSLGQVVLAVEGLGAAQELGIEFARDLQARTGKLDVHGTAPNGFRSVQLITDRGDVRDAVLTVYRSGPVRSNGTTRGTNVWITPAPAQQMFDLHGSLKADEITLKSTADAVNQSVSLSQYFYSYSPATPGAFGGCIWGGSYLPCTFVDLWRMPQVSSLTMVAPSPDCGTAQGVPELQYAASDSNLLLTVDSLIPCLGGSMAFYGLPAHGITMEGALGDFCNEGPQLSMKVTPGFGEVMPRLYIDGSNVPIVSVCTRTQELSGPPLPPGVTVRGTLTAQLNYRASITLQATPGLTEIAVVPVPDRKGQYFGLEGVMAKGDPSARMTIGMTLGLGPFFGTNGSLLPNEVSWQWEATALDFIEADSDWDTIRWYENDFNYGVGHMSSYVWEAFADNDARYTFDPNSCSSTGTQTNPHTMLSYAPSVPFQPGFTKVNNGLVVCGGRVAYYQLNPQNIAFRHCSEATWWECPGGLNTGATDEWSYADLQVQGRYSDWVLAAAMKALYNQDPAGLTKQLATP